MKRFIASSLFATALLTAAAAMAAEPATTGIDGKWSGMIGQSEIMFEFRAEGEKLTGTLNNATQPGAIEIREGTIKGGDIAFHVVRNLDNGETKIAWTGKLAGDELRLQRAAVGANAAADVVAKRVKP
jgi:opacity protein-like surface antigen